MADEEIIQDAGEMPDQHEAPTPDSAGDDVSEMRAEMERMRAALKKANAEAKDYRLKSAELTKAQEEAQRAADEEQGKYRELYEAERKRAEDAAAQAQALQTQMRNQAVKAALSDHARQLGFAEPGDVGNFIAVDAVEVDDSGKPLNAADLVKELAESKPYLLQRASAPNINAQSGNGNAPRPGQMTDAEINEYAAVLGLNPESVKAGLGIT